MLTNASYAKDRFLVWSTFGAHLATLAKPPTPFPGRNVSRAIVNTGEMWGGISSVSDTPKTPAPKNKRLLKILVLE
jgi:hypothetical protein